MTQSRGGPEAPRSPFPLLPLRTGVLFPGTVITLQVGRKRSAALVRDLKPGESVIGVAVQRDPDMEDPRTSDLHPVGTFARVHQVGRAGDEIYGIVVEGLGRFRMDSVVRSDPYWMAEGTPIADTASDPQVARNLADALRDRIQELATTATGLRQVAASMRQIQDPGLLADRVAAALEMDTDKEVQILLNLDVVDRLKRVTELAGEVKTLTDIKKKIDSEVRRELNKGQREALLRQQLRAIQKELGEETSSDDLSPLRDRLDRADLPDEARRAADRELRRLETMNPAQAEYNVVRTYLEWLADLPWSAEAIVHDDLDRVQRKLDDDHFGLTDVKRRILEHLAVVKLSGNPRGTILCLSGPPGVGKTSLGQSIADATGRPFVRIALGGVRDEAEIRGHRRTYVGSLPGRIIHAMKKAKVRNPVMLLDEVDKLAKGWMGDPEAALLEVLDPEQNKAFVDHYVELPFDLSEVLFICTVNNLENLSPPLRDRLEIIEISGYTPEEKGHIARKHLIPRQLREHGIRDDALHVSDEALKAVIQAYTRESGVRQLNREMQRLCRAIALEIARGADRDGLRVELTEDALSKYLGKARFFSDVAERTATPGVATGLAWTPVGGDILFIETSRMPGKGRLEITGQLGDVMKESARAALTFVRSNADALGVDPAFLESQDLHIHVPAGAVPKDGPSAGVTIFTALTSLLSGRRVRHDTAMTGECTLRGRVLPVGGIKAKVLAAHRAGITRVILPHRNLRDIDEVPEETREVMEFVFAEDMSQVLAAALEPDPADEGGVDAIPAVDSSSDPARAVA
ncbi:endopeptidase La [Myxococcota bacterium]|nr:endopeptidase La [Myxococcota bacterium]